LLNKVVDHLLIIQLQVFGKQVFPWQYGQVALLIGGIDPFEDRGFLAQVGCDLPDKIVVVYQIPGPQVVNPVFAPIDHVVDLLA
jgi:hypothetical protein